MARMDRGHARLAGWFVLTTFLILTLYWNQLFILTSGLDQLLTATLGTVFPAYPFLALLVLLTALRWRDFHKVLLAEKGLTSNFVVRMLGVLLILLPAALWPVVFVSGGPSTYLAMELSASSIVLVAYGTLVVISPLMWKAMLPYASLYALGLVSPLFLLDTLGAPLASLSSLIAAGMTSALGVHVLWQGVSFTFISISGDSISTLVTPVCSAAYSIGIYLALLGLMYLDIGSNLSTTAKFAVIGVAIIPVLDSARIALMIWVGYMEGSAAFWGIHDWLGYAIFLGFYIVTLITYSKTVNRQPGLRETVYSD